MLLSYSLSTERVRPLCPAGLGRRDKLSHLEGVVHSSTQNGNRMDGIGMWLVGWNTLRRFRSRREVLMNHNPCWAPDVGLLTEAAAKAIRR